MTKIQNGDVFLSLLLNHSTNQLIIHCRKMVSAIHKIFHKTFHHGLILEVHVHQARGAQQTANHIKCSFHGFLFFCCQLRVDKIAFAVDIKTNALQDMVEEIGPQGSLVHVRAAAGKPEKYIIIGGRAGAESIQDNEMIAKAQVEIQVIIGDDRMTGKHGRFGTDDATVHNDFIMLRPVKMSEFPPADVGVA